MHALQPRIPTPPPIRRVRTTPRPRHRQRAQRAIAIESSIKLAVNLVLSTVAFSSLAHLIPYINNQQAKLEEVQAAVKSTDARLKQSQLAFSRYFDPYQTKTLMQEQSDRLDPKQRQVVFEPPAIVRPAAATTAAIQPQPATANTALALQVPDNGMQNPLPRGEAAELSGY